MIEDKIQIIKTEGKILTHKAKTRIIIIEGKILTHKAYPGIPFLYHMFLRKLCQVVLPSSQGYAEIYANFYRQPVDNQFQNYNRNDIGNQRYNDYPNQANMRYNGNNFQGMENARQNHPQFYQGDSCPMNVTFQGNL